MQRLCVDCFNKIPNGVGHFYKDFKFEGRKKRLYFCCFEHMMNCVRKINDFVNCLNEIKNVRRN